VAVEGGIVSTKTLVALNGRIKENVPRIQRTCWSAARRAVTPAEDQQFFNFGFNHVKIPMKKRKKNITFIRILGRF